MGKFYSSLFIVLLTINNLFATDSTAVAALNGSKKGLEAIPDAVSISITGLISVFAALATISLLISALPLLLSFINKYVPEEVPHKKAPAKNKTKDNGGAVALAIAAAFHKRNKG